MLQCLLFLLQLLVPAKVHRGSHPRGPPAHFRLAAFSRVPHTPGSRALVGGRALGSQHRSRGHGPSGTHLASDTCPALALRSCALWSSRPRHAGLLRGHAPCPGDSQARPGPGRHCRLCFQGAPRSPPKDHRQAALDHGGAGQPWRQRGQGALPPYPGGPQPGHGPNPARRRGFPRLVQEALAARALDLRRAPLWALHCPGAHVPHTWHGWEGGRCCLLLLSPLRRARRARLVRGPHTSHLALDRRDGD
mmetsp:Transcript_3706/g.10973  ORF Transcript_3706/g.10973 Transcript_3706/m.10973 type:complete len:249 (+) Transcript_3706:585-1331(+)